MSSPWEKLPPDFYLRDTVEVAKDLIGRYLIREVPGGRLACRITETEAYCGPADPACHSCRKAAKKGGRTNVMYEAGGLAYIYLIYGMHCCFNVVTRPKGEPEAVLVRSAQPLLGLPQMARNRGLTAAGEETLSAGPKRPGAKERPRRPPKPGREALLLTGPGKLCQGMEIDRKLYGEPLWGEKLWLAWGEPVPGEAIAATPRINVDYAGEAAAWPWRFVERESLFLSVKYKEAVPIAAASTSAANFLPVFVPKT